MLTAISKNRKLQYLNLQGNSLVDSKADKYDDYVFDVDEIETRNVSDDEGDSKPATKDGPKN